MHMAKVSLAITLAIASATYTVHCTTNFTTMRVDIEEPKETPQCVIINSCRVFVKGFVPVILI